MSDKLLNKNGLTYLISKIKTAMSELVPQTRTINGKNLENDITLSPEDINAYRQFTVEHGSEFAEWEIGVISAWGGNQDNAARLRTSTYLTDKVGVISVADGYEYCLYVYRPDSTGSYFSINGATSSGTFTSENIDLSAIPDEYDRYRIILRHTDETIAMNLEDADVLVRTSGTSIPSKASDIGALSEETGTTLINGKISKISNPTANKVLVSNSNGEAAQTNVTYSTVWSDTGEQGCKKLTFSLSGTTLTITTGT